MPTSARGVTKEVFLNAFTCRTAGWFVRHQVGIVAPTPGDLLRMEQGREVGRRARNALPKGIFVAAQGAEDAATVTKRLVNDRSVSTLFEATFKVDHYTAKADILRREPKGWHLIEVKSNTADDDELVDDLTYTAMVMHRSGVQISKASLWLISKDYRLGMPDKDLFTEIDHTAEVLQRLRDFLLVWDDADAMTGKPRRPKPTLIWACRDCAFFESECLGKGIDDHVFELPRLRENRFNELTAAGIAQIAAIPAGFGLGDDQERVWQCVVSGKPDIDKAALASHLASVVWPAYYLDFETAMTAIPLYPDIAPYTQVPTQYSVHVCSGLGKVSAHHEFLAPDPTRDCRHELAEQLIADLGRNGSVIVYHAAFESTVIRKLADTFPDLAKQLEAILPRIVDLKVFIQDGVYHPDFHGSRSIKMTLPALVAGMGYDDLEIGDGDTAVAKFVLMARSQCGSEEAKKIRQDLLTYCKQDTLAMVRLHQELQRFVTLGC